MSRPSLRLTVAVAALVACTASLLGCSMIFGGNCTLAYYPDSLAVRFVASSWPAGDWSFAVDDARCTVTLPGGAERCSGGLSALTSRDGTAVLSIWLDGKSPTSFLLVVARDGREVLRKSVTPSYTESEPEGEACGVRREGEVVVTIAP
jgi:hypothetical protein